MEAENKELQKSADVQGNKKAKDEGTGLTDKILQDKGKESSKNIKKGEANVTVKLTKSSKVLVEFTKKVGKHIEKGHKQYLSELAYAAYDKIGAVKKI